MANKPVQNEFGKTRTSVLFQDFQNLQRIWTHPRVLRYNSDRYELAAQKRKLLESDEEGSLKDFIDDEDDDNSGSDTSSSSSSNDSDVQSVHSDQPSGSKKATRTTRAMAKESMYLSIGNIAISNRFISSFFQIRLFSWWLRRSGAI